MSEHEVFRLNYFCTYIWLGSQYKFSKGTPDPIFPLPDIIFRSNELILILHLYFFDFGSWPFLSEEPRQHHIAFDESISLGVLWLWLFTNFSLFSWVGKTGEIKWSFFFFRMFLSWDVGLCYWSLILSLLNRYAFGRKLSQVKYDTWLPVRFTTMMLNLNTWLV